MAQEVERLAEAEREAKKLEQLAETDPEPQYHDGVFYLFFGGNRLTPRSPLERTCLFCSFILGETFAAHRISA